MKKSAGFSLIELLFTMALVGVMLTIATPSIQAFRQSNLLIAATNDLISALHIARSEAIKLNQRVSICSSSNGTSCSDSTEWKDGWIVFVDADGDFSGTGVVCAAVGTDCLLRSHDSFNNDLLSLVGEDANSIAVTKLTFTSRGLPKDSSGASRSGFFNICSLDDDGSTDDSRAVILGLSGRVRVSDNAERLTLCPT